MTKGALEGLKVLDFTIQAAGPHGVRQVTDWGATVVKVESIARPDTFRQGAPMKDNIPGVDRSLKFLAQNAGKLSLGLNLKYPQGLDIAKKLVKWADLMYQNFAGGVIKRMGLGYDVVKEINPSIIMVSSGILGDKSVDKPVYKIARGGQTLPKQCRAFII